jgi:hypothetical protein
MLNADDITFTLKRLTGEFTDSNVCVPAVRCAITVSRVNGTTTRAFPSSRDLLHLIQASHRSMSRFSMPKLMVPPHVEGLDRWVPVRRLLGIIVGVVERIKAS